MVSSVGSSGPSAKRLAVSLNRLLAPYPTALSMSHAQKRTSDPVLSLNFQSVSSSVLRLQDGLCDMGIAIDNLEVRQAPEIKQLRPRQIPVFAPHAK
jgi:hypothetical protein